MNSSAAPFESILRLHRHRRDENQLDLAGLFSQHESVVNQLASLRGEHDRLLRIGATSRTRVVTVAELRELERRDIQFRETEKAWILQSDSLSVRIDDQRAILLEAQREVQKLEKLQAIRLAEHQMQANRAAQQSFDEQASVTFQRSHG